MAAAKGASDGGAADLQQQQQQQPMLKYKVLPGNESVLMREALQRRPWWRPMASDTDRWNFWYGCNGQKFSFKTFLGAPKARQLVNRLENHREICTKTGLAVILDRILRQAPEPMPWIPETHVLAARGSDAKALSKWKQAYTRHRAAGSGTTWIVKPASLNRGNGIEVFNKQEDVVGFLEGRSAGSKWIVQKYIDSPLLVGGRKFDIRAYCLVDHRGRVFLHREAYVRTSATPYVLEDLSNRSAHLTNDAVQKKLEDYHTYEDHCKLALDELQVALGSGDPAASPVDVRGSAWPQVQQIVRHLFGMAAPRLNPRRLSHCFELLGLDFMLDSAGQAYLIEVNTSPALFRAGQYLADLLPRVTEEIAQKVIDDVFPPPATAQLAEPLDGFELVDLVPYDSGPATASPLVLGPRRSRSIGPNDVVWGADKANGGDDKAGSASAGGSGARALQRSKSSGLRRWH